MGNRYTSQFKERKVTSLPREQVFSPTSPASGKRPKAPKGAKGEPATRGRPR